MRIFISVLLLLLISLLGSRWSFSKLKLPVFAHHIYLTGIEFIVAGYLLGSSGINFFTPGMLLDLRPIQALTLGWVGLLFGLQLDFRLLSWFPTQYLKISLSQALLTFLIALFPIFLLVRSIPGAGLSSIIFTTIILSALTSCTAQASLAILQNEFHLEHEQLFDFLRYVSSIDAIVAILICGIMSGFFSAGLSFGNPFINMLTWFFIISFFGVVLGLLFDVLLRSKCHHSELLVFAIGFVSLASGFSFYARTSVIFLTTIMGAVIANGHHAKRLLALMAKYEKQAYILLLLFAGATINSIVPGEIFYILIFPVIRLLSKFLSGLISSRIFCYFTTIPKYFGLGLISDGGISLAIAMSYQHVAPGPLSKLVLAIVLGSIIINEIFSTVLFAKFPREGTRR